MESMKTVFIPGSSPGIGKETALYFLKQGWQEELFFWSLFFTNKTQRQARL